MEDIMKKLFTCLAASLLLCLAVAAMSLAGEIIPQYDGFSTKASSDNGLTVRVKTNLPDGTCLDVGLWQRSPNKKYLYTAMPLSYPDETNIQVSGGGIEASFPSVYEKGLPAGNYDISISVIQAQPNATLGDKNALLSGPEVETLPNGYKEHTARFGVVVSQPLPPHPKKLPE